MFKKMECIQLDRTENRLKKPYESYFIILQEQHVFRVFQILVLGQLCGKALHAGELAGNKHFTTTEELNRNLNIASPDESVVYTR